MEKGVELIGDFKIYAEMLEILESAKLAAKDIDTLGNIEEEIRDIKVIQSQVALRILIENKIIK